MREFLRVAAEKGADPRLFTLLAFGGAGPTQACRLAEDLHMSKIVIPPGPGTFAAWGSLSADFRIDYVRTVYNDLAHVDPADIDNWYEEIKTEGELMLSGSSRFLEKFQITKTADMRYRLQGYDIPITFTSPNELDGQFRRRYYELYGHWDEQTPLDLVSLQGTVVGTVKRPSLFELKARQSDANQGVATKTAPKRRRAYIRNSWLEVDVLDIADLSEGSRIVGPCIVEQSDTTCLVLDGWHGEVNNFGAIVLGRETY
jgi:N-methylhydantoinase A